MPPDASTITVGLYLRAPLPRPDALPLLSSRRDAGGVQTRVQHPFHPRKGSISHPSQTQPPQYAMTVLVADVEEAQRLAAALDEVRRADAPLAVIAVPPVRGLSFFADGERQAKLDRWWAHAIPRNSEPI